MPFRLLSLLALALSLSPVIAAECSARSGALTNALVELYTSEGCSSCPPADRALSRLPATANIVPLALHVDYWDDLGWRDPYAQPGFARRQRWLSEIAHRHVVYTPQVLLSGRDIDWRDGIDNAARDINRRPARAVLQVALDRKAGRLVVSAWASNVAASGTTRLQVALTEDGLSSDVRAGENRGERLTHDHVVRRWFDAVPVSQGAASLREDIALPADWNAARLSLVAFVQDTASGEVLQALARPACGRE